MHQLKASHHGTGPTHPIHAIMIFTVNWDAMIHGIIHTSLTGHLAITTLLTIVDILAGDFLAEDFLAEDWDDKLRWVKIQPNAEHEFFKEKASVQF